MFYILCAVLLVILVYKYIITPHSYWQSKGVKFHKPSFFFGCMLDIVLQRRAFFDVLKEVYQESENERYYGMYQFLKPVLLIKDPELIKRTTIKDFDSFMDHSGFSSEDIDPLWAKNLVSSKGQKWQALRATLSPAFTSSKMKMMFTLMDNCAQQFTNHFLKKSDNITTVEMRDIITRYTNDVIATCAFGINVDSLTNPKNDFYINGIETANLEGIKGLKFFLNGISPTLMRWLRIRILSNGDFFRKIISDTIKLREEKNIIRPDMIHLLLQARKGLLESEPDENGVAKKINEKLGHLELSDEDITAQAMIFFLGGFDSSATLMVYVSYALATNVDIQNKLKEEIDAALKKCDGKITYDVLTSMKYFDMIISETLRCWPQGPMTERVCTKDYEIPAERPGEKTLFIQKGTTIWYPVCCLQKDPKYFPNPDKFDPERFSDENKSSIKPETYLAFGIGPRNCIGSRFALLETKVLLFHLLTRFEIVPVLKSRIPVVQSKKTFVLRPEGGMWLGLKKR